MRHRPQEWRGGPTATPGHDCKKRAGPVVQWPSGHSSPAGDRPRLAIALHYWQRWQVFTADEGRTELAYRATTLLVEDAETQLAANPYRRHLSGFPDIHRVPVDPTIRGRRRVRRARPSLP